MKQTQAYRRWFHTACSAVVMVTLAWSETRAQQTEVKIVGIGAASCAEFLRQAQATPAVQRDYLAWAQGFMSAILITRPAGVDEKVDLLPPTMRVEAQLQFLHEQCDKAPETSFSETVEVLYKHLRQLSGHR